MNGVLAILLELALSSGPLTIGDQTSERVGEPRLSPDGEWG